MGLSGPLIFILAILSAGWSNGSCSLALRDTVFRTIHRQPTLRQAAENEELGRCGCAVLHSFWYTSAPVLIQVILATATNRSSCGTWLDSINPLVARLNSCLCDVYTCICTMYVYIIYLYVYILYVYTFSLFEKLSLSFLATCLVVTSCFIHDSK